MNARIHKNDVFYEFIFLASFMKGYCPKCTFRTTPVLYFHFFYIFYEFIKMVYFMNPRIHFFYKIFIFNLIDYMLLFLHLH